jgi:hypothetical protein
MNYVKVKNFIRAINLEIENYLDFMNPQTNDILHPLASNFQFKY